MPPDLYFEPGRDKFKVFIVHVLDMFNIIQRQTLIKVLEMYERKSKVII